MVEYYELHTGNRCMDHFDWTFARNGSYAPSKAIGFISIVLSPITVILNLATLAAIVKFRRLQTNSSISLINLSVTALLTGIVAQPLYAIVFLFADSNRRCLVALCFEIIGYSLVWSLFLTLCMIATERYLTIFHPFRHGIWITKKKLLFATMFIWLFSISISTCMHATYRIEEIIHYVNMSLTAVGTAWILHVYRKVLLLVRSIRRRVDDGQRRYSMNIVRTRIRNGNKHAWCTVLAIIALIFFCVSYNALVLYLHQRQNSLSTIAKDRLRLFLSWQWSFFLFLISLTPLIQWVSSSEIRASLKRVLLGLLPEDNSSHRTRLSKLLRPALISQFRQSKAGEELRKANRRNTYQ